MLHLSGLLLQLGMVLVVDAPVFSPRELPCDVQCVVNDDSVNVVVTVDRTLVDSSMPVALWRAQAPFDPRPVERVGSRRVQFQFRASADSAWNRMLVWVGRPVGQSGDRTAPSYRLYLASALRPCGVVPNLTALAERVAKASVSQPTARAQLEFLGQAPGVAFTSSEPGSGTVTMTLVDGTTVVAAAVADAPAN
jgi:hypothetical protein